MSRIESYYAKIFGRPRSTLGSRYQRFAEVMKVDGDELAVRAAVENGLDGAVRVEDPRYGKSLHT